MNYRVLNAADYGKSTMTRQRVIIIGVRNDIDFEYIFPVPTNSKDGEDGLPKWVSVGESNVRSSPILISRTILPNHDYSKYKLQFNGLSWA